MYPTLLQFGPLTISSLWVVSLICVYIFVKLLAKRLHKQRDDFKFLYDHSTFLLICAIIGSRLGYVVMNLDSFTGSIYNILYIGAIWDQGFSFLGGIIGLSLGLLKSTSSFNERFAKWTDYLSLPLLYIMPLVSIGEFLDGSGYGSQTDLPFGVTFTNINIAIVTPVHPVQIYSAILHAIALIIITTLIRRRSEIFEKEGALSCLIFFSIALVSFIESFFRGDTNLTIWIIKIHTILSLIASIYAFRLFLKIIKHND